MAERAAEDPGLQATQAEQAESCVQATQAGPCGQATQAGQGVELRIHGVGGSTPEKLLGERHPDQVVELQRGHRTGL